jgi:hypothetical protein
MHMKRALLCATAALALVATGSAGAVASGPSISYVPSSLVESTIFNGPWVLHQSGHYNPHDASGIVPTTSGPPYTGSGTPYADYCKGGSVTGARGYNPMQPYYFPFVRLKEPGVLEGYFDYRPRNEQEATVYATSTDNGATWRFDGEALGLNPYCPWDATDPNNLNVSVAGVETAYGSNAANAADNGLGHAFVLTVKNQKRLYLLNRATGHIDSDQLVVHALPHDGAVTGLPSFGFVSPLASGGYPTLDPTATATAGLQNPDAILGALVQGHETTILYVEKTLNGDTSFPTAQQCPKTPAFALTNLINGTAKKANHDVTTIRVATTTDGVNFTDVGPASGLNDPTTVALNGIRWLGSGSILRLGDGRYAMFFGGGNCLDNDSDAFHFLGYAETVNPVNSPSDLLQWQVVNGFDNPILSTDTVVNNSQTPPRAYPMYAPIVNVAGVDPLTAAQVAPFTPPASGYNTNFYSGRAYDPQAIYTDDHTVTIVFAGYNTPQPSNNLGDYRTIGRFQLTFPAGYFAVP